MRFFKSKPSPYIGFEKSLWERLVTRLISNVDLLLDVLRKTLIPFEFVNPEGGTEKTK